MNRQNPKSEFNIPDLRVLPVGALVPHEHADWKRVSRLEGRLRRDGYLKNPPIVAPMPGTERFVVLDGANRTGAIANIGCPHILAQVVDYKSEAVQLVTWHHLITGRNPAMFLEEIESVPNLDVHEASLQEARVGLVAQEVFAYIVVPTQGKTVDTRVYTVSPTVRGREGDGTAQLNAMVDTYKSDPDTGIGVSTYEWLLLAVHCRPGACVNAQ